MMKDQAETLRLLMKDRETASGRESAIAVYLSPETKRRRLFSPRELALQNRKMGGKLRVRDETDPLIAEASAAEISVHLTVLTGLETDLEECALRIKKQAKLEGVKRLDVIVCGVDGEAEGRRIFTKLFEGCRPGLAREPDVDLHYVGAFSTGEKIGDSLAISKFLLHYQSRAGSLIGRKS